MQASAASAGRMVGTDLVGMERFDDRSARTVAGRRFSMYNAMRERNACVDM